MYRETPEQEPFWLYADKGNLDEETLRDNPTVAGMFQEYADQIEWAQQKCEGHSIAIVQAFWQLVKTIMNLNTL